MKRILMTLLLSGVAVTGHAGVIYNWVDVTINPNVGPITGVIEIAPDSWQLGSSLYADMNSGVPRPIRLAESPILDFQFKASGPLLWLDIDWQVEGCVTDETMDNFCVDSYDEGELVIIGDGTGNTWGIFDLHFGPFLSGNIIQAGGGFTQVDLSGGLLWTLNTVRSDGPNCDSNSGPNADNPECQGSQGFWVLDVDTVPVVEPQTFSLSLLGLGALIIFRRQRKADGALRCR